MLASILVQSLTKIKQDLLLDTHFALNVSTLYCGVFKSDHNKSFNCLLPFIHVLVSMVMCSYESEKLL